MVYLRNDWLLGLYYEILTDISTQAYCKYLSPSHSCTQRSNVTVLWKKWVLGKVYSRWEDIVRRHAVGLLLIGTGRRQQKREKENWRKRRGGHCLIMGGRITEDGDKSAHKKSWNCIRSAQSFSNFAFSKHSIGNIEDKNLTFWVELHWRVLRVKI
jgi:hypothetical protein